MAGGTSRWLVIFAVIALSLRGHAQSTNATCTLGGYDWAFNLAQQSPCQVASTLFGVCTPGEPHFLPSLPSDHHYRGPTNDHANSCQCNTVSYSLVSACAACQNRTVTRWSEWSVSCPMVYISSIPEPIPEGLSVPGWAYLDVKAQDSFDTALARQNTNLTESTAVPFKTSTSTSTTLISSATSSGTASTALVSTTPSSADPMARTDRIGNIVVGTLLGVAALLAIVCLLIWWRRRKQRQRAEPLNSVEGLPEMASTAPTKIVVQSTEQKA